MTSLVLLLCTVTLHFASFFRVVDAIHAELLSEEGKQSAKEQSTCLKHSPPWLGSLNLRTDTQITFSLHFIPLRIRLSSLVAQPGAFLV